MKNKYKQLQPWCDSNGIILPDEELQTISKHWDQNTWDEYLKFYTSEKEDERTENADEQGLEFIYSNSVEPTFLTGGDHVPERLKSQLRKAMKSLTARQKYVVENIFLKSLSEYQVAKLLGISRSTVQEHKEAAIRHLKNNLGVDPSISPIGEGARKLRPRTKVEDEGAEI